MIEYKSNPDLKFVKQGWEGNVSINGRFHKDTLIESTPFWHAFKWKLSTNPQQEEKKNEIYHLPVQKFDKLSDENGITWLGHSTFVIQINGIRIITDPVFYNIPLHERKTELPCHPDSLENMDYMLISHDHLDHFCKKSIAFLANNNPGIKVKAPLNAQRLFNKETLKKIQLQEAGWYQEYETEGHIRIIFLPAKHWGRRGINDFNKTLWGSFLMISGNTKIFFAGDSAYDENLYKEIFLLFGQIDICILPIGAYSPQWLMSKSHMNPQEAIKAFYDLHGYIFIPMHYGTFDLSDEPMGEPIKKIREYSQNSTQSIGVKELAVGEKMLLT